MQLYKLVCLDKNKKKQPVPYVPHMAVNAQDIECAKAWVEGNSCPAWRDGWLMVDGTLVQTFQ